ncbi:hypothetical protein L6164_007050 [Bauhinia variegata]|uniref:Uncharacterized protein n=1 Tax=Bauhinia variegata TaxID=167791 RepID=A0ACB9PWB6_BAUVA|nr:hypothetical protein L6164_007050 [Bauhinia variegata]
MVEGWLKSPTKLPSIPRTIRSTKDHLDILDHILIARPKLKHIKDETGGTPLHRAALLGHLEVVRKLLEQHPASAIEWNTKGYLPIHLASKKGHVSVVKEILNKVTWLDPIDLLKQKGQNILHMAAKNGKHEVVKFIPREKKLHKLLNEKDKKGNTPLHSASLASQGFTVPDGFIDSDDKDITNIGMATLISEFMFKVIFTWLSVPHTLRYCCGRGFGYNVHSIHGCFTCSRERSLLACPDCHNHGNHLPIHILGSVCSSDVPNWSSNTFELHRWSYFQDDDSIFWKL